MNEPLNGESKTRAGGPTSSTEPALGSAGPAPGFPRPGKLKHMVVVGYIIDHGKVLLVWHEKLRRWLPPGGHVEEGELPTEAVVREVLEETGYAVAVRGATSLAGNEPGVQVLPSPHHIQVEYIDELHDHLDLAYECRLVDPTPAAAAASRHRWFTDEELAAPGVGENVRHFSRLLLRAGNRTALEIKR